MQHTMAPTRLLPAIAGLLMTLLFATGARATLVDDFGAANALDAYAVSGAVSRPDPGFALFEEDPSGFSELAIPLTLPGEAARLAFDFSFWTEGPGTGGLFGADTFVLVILPDDLALLPVEPLIVEEPAAPIPGGPVADPFGQGLAAALASSAGVPGFAPPAGGVRYDGSFGVDIPVNLFGEDVTLLFALNDNDAPVSTAAIDNLSLATAAVAVPEPAPWALLLAGALVVAGRARR